MSDKHKFTIHLALITLTLFSPYTAGAQEKTKFPAGAYQLRGAPMVFTNEGTFKIGDDKTLFVEGRYAVKGDEISFTDVGGQYACKGEGEQTGTYRWESKSEGLVFHLVKDGCEARRTALLEGVVTRAKE